jgi:hypothetical protein
MTLGSVIGGGLLGLVLGMRHALEPDHLAALSTLLAERPKGRAATIIGAAWGVGHALALCLLGGALLVLRAELPGWLGACFELAVALMLIVLGVRALRLGARALGRAAAEGRHGVAARAPHRHGHVHHEHDGPAEHLHLYRFTLARRPLLIGLVHGLAGSGALAALAVASAPSRAAGLAYVVLFGLGSVAGMAAVTGVSAWWLRRLGLSAGGRGQTRLTTAAGLVSIGVGVWWAMGTVFPH